MTELRDQASLHEETVKRAEALAKEHRRRKGTGKRRPYSSRVQVRREVHPLVWAEALRIANGDASRIEVRDRATVVVR